MAPIAVSSQSAKIARGGLTRALADPHRRPGFTTLCGSGVPVDAGRYNTTHDYRYARARRGRVSGAPRPIPRGAAA